MMTGVALADVDAGKLDVAVQAHEFEIVAADEVALELRRQRQPRADGRGLGVVGELVNSGAVSLAST